MSATPRWFGLIVSMSVTACGDEGPKPRAPMAPQSQVEEEEQLAACDVPSEPEALLEYLRRGDYKSFERESAPHASTGPHGGQVLTYVNDVLAQSLEQGDSEHPRCAASVKELFLGRSEVSGWAVFVKTQDQSKNGNGFYWFEVLQPGANRADFQGQGIAICVGCHSTGIDYFRAPWPLQ